jgi:hypothetical protein
VEKKDDFTVGPMALIYHAVKEHTQVSEFICILFL